jgi:CubicO group peptidase (beta-lactamase class C family)
MPGRRRRALLAIACGALLAIVPAGEALAASTCSPPAPGAEWTRVDPSRVDLDPRAVQDALTFATGGASSATAAVYRHGCLAGTDPMAPATRDRRYESWSTAKSVVSLAAGRAMTLGLLSADDRVGGLVPEADRAHGAVTLRQLLQMASGLHWNFFRDYSLNPSMHRVNDALTLPFDHRPGTYFEYAQSTVALVAEMVGRAAGTDFQTFVQRELFGPVGIARGSWTWARERHGNTLAFMGLQLQPRDYARLGHLMLERGVWRGRRLLSEAYVKAATTPSENNPSYGWFWWLNSGSRFIGPTIEGRAEYAGRLVESGPPDMYSAIGFDDQFLMVIPSLDVVFTRSGGASGPGRGDPVGSAGFKHEVVRRLMRAVKDERVPDPGPAQAKAPLVPRDPSYGIGHSATETVHVAAARNTPPLPPAGPAVARAVLIGGLGVHSTPLAGNVRKDGSVALVLGCPRAGRSACHGAATLTRSGRRIARPIDYRIARGARARVRFELNGSLRRGTALLRVKSLARAGATVSEATIALKP